VTAGEEQDVHVCALCADPDPLNLGVCPECASARDGEAGMLVFLERPPGVIERDESAVRLSSLLGERAHGEAGRRVAAGERPLLRASAGTAARVVERLANRGMPARAVRYASAWRRMPTHFFVMLLAIAIAGVAAGMRAVMFAMLTPAMIGAMIAAAQIGLRQPLLAAGGRRSVLAPDIERRLVETVAHLPPGNARTLLIDLIRLTQPLLVSLQREHDFVEVGASLEELLDAACITSLEIHRVDGAFDLLQRRSDADRSDDRLNEAAATDADRSHDRLNEAAATCGRARETGVRRMIEAIAVVGQLGGGAIASATEAGARLSAVTRELATQARAQEEAAREIERLLGEPLSIQLR
jgi:hypothetical protein